MEASPRSIAEAASGRPEKKLMPLTTFVPVTKRPRAAMLVITDFPQGELSARLVCRKLVVGD
jgi:hypothetical protein